MNGVEVRGVRTNYTLPWVYVCYKFALQIFENTPPPQSWQKTDPFLEQLNNVFIFGASYTYLDHGLLY